jgi:AraC family transcriptional regulator
VPPCASSSSNQKSRLAEPSDSAQDALSRQFTEVSGQLIRRRIVGPFTLSEIVYPGELSLPKHAHRHAYVTFVIEGAFHEMYSSGEIACRTGAVRFLPAAEVHENRIEAGARCLHISSDPAVLEQLRQRPVIPRKPAEIIGLATTWLAHRLYAEFSRQDAASAMAIEGLILEILAEIARSETQQNGVLAPQWLKRATEIVETRFLERLSLAEIASEVGVHYVHLSRQFHKYNRCTIGELIRKRRVQYACQLLAYSRTPLAEIALICGFSDQSHLSFLFKRYMGLSPSKFRNLAGLNYAATMGDDPAAVLGDEPLAYRANGSGT